MSLRYLLVLEDKDIIQVDATVIVGALVLLTLTSVVNVGIGGSDSLDNVQKQDRIWRTMFTAVIVVPFSASAVMVIFANTLKNANDKIKLTHLALSAMVAGFGYLIIVMLALIAFSTGFYKI